MHECLPLIQCSCRRNQSIFSTWATAAMWLLATSTVPTCFVCSQTHLSGHHWDLIMSIHFDRVSTYPCFILYIVSTQDQTNDVLSFWASHPGARFTKYLTTILRLSYDNAKVAIDLRLTSNLQNVLQRTQSFSEARFNCKVVRSSETVFAN